MVGATFENSLRGLRKFAFGGFCFLHLCLLFCSLYMSQALKRGRIYLYPRTAANYHQGNGWWLFGSLRTRIS